MIRQYLKKSVRIRVLDSPFRWKDENIPYKDVKGPAECPPNSRQPIADK